MILDVDPAQFPRDGRVLLGDVRRVPRVELQTVRPVIHRERDDSRCGEPFRETTDRDIGGSLKGEDVRLRIARHHQAVGSQSGKQSFLGEGRLLLVVDQDVIQEAVAVLYGDGGLVHQPREVYGALSREDLEIPPVEEGDFPPALEAVATCPLQDVLGGGQGFLGTHDELANFVGKSTHPDHRTARRPLPRVLTGQKLAHLRELVGRGQDLRRARIVERAEPGCHHVMGQAVDGHHLEGGKRCPEAGQQERAGLLACSSGSNDQGDTFGVGARLHEPRESLPKGPRLAGPRRSGDQQGASVVFQQGCLVEVGLQRHRPAC